MKKYKVGYTENLNTLVTYINTSPSYILWKDLLQFAVDYDCFVDLYMNTDILEKLRSEHNLIVKANKK